MEQSDREHWEEEGWSPEKGRISRVVSEMQKKKHVKFKDEVNRHWHST